MYCEACSGGSKGGSTGGRCSPPPQTSNSSLGEGGLVPAKTQVILLFRKHGLLIWDCGQKFCVRIILLHLCSPFPKSWICPWHVQYYYYAGCFEKRIYTGTVCSEELQQWQMCFSSQQTNDVFVPSNIDQEGAEAMANQLLTGLQFFSASPECVTAIKPFMCLYLFGSCDANNQLRQVSQSECMRLRDDVCAEPWERINMFQEGALPDCSTFVDQEIECLGI